MILILINSFTCFSQSIEDFKKVELKKIDTLLSLHKDRKSLVWLNLIPNISYNYQPILDRNFISASLNLSSLASYFQTKKRNQVEVSKLKLLLNEKLENNVNSLYKDLEEIQRDSILIALEEENFNLSKELFDLKKQQYERDKITLENWLQIQQNHQSKVINLKAKKETYNIKKSNLIRKLKNQ